MYKYSTLKIITLSFCTVLLLAVSSSCSKDAFPDGNPCEFPTSLDGYDLVWQDEFDAAELDTTKWTAMIGDGCDYVRDEGWESPVGDGCSEFAFDENGNYYLYGGCGWGNRELQYYTDRRTNVRLENGKLVITAKRETPPLNGYEYTSARLTTRDKADFKYGRIDVNARIPRGQGVWSAIWLLSTESKYGCWPRSGEIDIMESIGNEPTKVFSTVHYGHDFWRLSGFDTTGIDFSQDFHTYTLLWAEDCLRFMVDGEIVGNPITPSFTLPTTYPYNELFHLILNVSVGGNLPGDPLPSTPLPQKMEVEYVRVYKEK